MRTKIRKKPKKIKVRKDLMGKSKYSKLTGKSRSTLDRMIERGELSVEDVDGTHFIKLTPDEIRVYSD